MIKMNKKLSIGFLESGGSLKMENGFLGYKHPYGRTFRVRIKDIDTVTVDTIGRGKGELKIIGKGTELAKAEMPINWADMCQDWILENLDEFKN